MIIIICRTQLAEWRASKGIGVKKVPAPVPADTQPEIEVLQHTTREPVKSFWAAIAEDDEQELFRDTVDKTLKECLHSIKEVRCLLAMVMMKQTLECSSITVIQAIQNHLKYNHLC